MSEIEAEELQKQQKHRDVFTLNVCFSIESGEGQIGFSLFSKMSVSKKEVIFGFARCQE